MINNFNKWQKDWRKKTDNKSTKKYEKTKKGYLMRTYRNMLSRVVGIQYKKAHLYKGKSILDKKNFYDWSLKNTEFNNLFDNWVEKKYDRKLSPSINRIDTQIGYEIDNMEWITHSENSRLGSIKRHSITRH